MRCFLGLDLPDAVRAQTAALYAAWRGAGLKASWVRPENLHVTVRFLGDIAPDQLEALDGVMDHGLEACGPLSLRLAGAGAFPNARRPSVIWAGVRVEAGDLRAVFAAGEAGAWALGLPPEGRDPHPHVTIARLRVPPPPGRVESLLETARAWESDAFQAAGVALWKSTLRPGGAVYDKLREYPLE